MEITLNITEDSKVALAKDSCEAVQGENNVTILNVNFPSTIRGYSIDNYTKQIEFCECKELGECKKFLDVLEGNTYKLCKICTQFEKLMIQFTLKNLVDEAEPIIWKSVPFTLEFCESINAENTKEAQVAILSLAEIEKEWEEYIRANTFRVISRVGDVPTADATSLDDTIFYLGANSTSPYVLTYGHYYKCNFVNGAYEWTDLTQDPSLEGVANGIREINNNQTMQVWVGSKEELENEVLQENTAYILDNQEFEDVIDEIVAEGVVIKRYKNILTESIDLGTPPIMSSSALALSLDFDESKQYVVCFDNKGIEDGYLGRFTNGAFIFGRTETGGVLNNGVEPKLIIERGFWGYSNTLKELHISDFVHRSIIQFADTSFTMTHEEIGGVLTGFYEVVDGNAGNSLGNHELYM